MKRKEIIERIKKGEIKPVRYYNCKTCGKRIPFYTSALQNVEQVTCPTWMYDNDCGEKYRLKKLREKQKKRKSAKKGKVCPPLPTTAIKNARTELCSKTPSCVHISKCLDKEIMKPGTMPLKADGSCKEEKVYNQKLTGINCGNNNKCTVRL